MSNKYATIKDAEYPFIEAFIDKPEVTTWYVNAFKRFNINGVDVLRWHWSWWAFFGSYFFLLYRKAYLPALFVFIGHMVLFPIPFANITLAILTGGYATYGVYKTYKEKRLEVEALVKDESKRIETLRLVGGYNEWVLWVAIAINVVFLAMFLFFFSAIILFITALIAS